MTVLLMPVRFLSSEFPIISTPSVLHSTNSYHSHFIIQLIYKNGTHIPLTFFTYFSLHFLKPMPCPCPTQSGLKMGDGVSKIYYLSDRKKWYHIMLFSYALIIYRRKKTSFLVSLVVILWLLSQKYFGHSKHVVVLRINILKAAYCFADTSYSILFHVINWCTYTLLLSGRSSLIPHNW